MPRLFQSAPANYGGRIARASVTPRTAIHVSIRARQLRRANLYYRNLLIKFKYW